MFLIVTDITKRFQVSCFVRSAGNMVFNMVQFQMAGIRRVPFFMCPPAFLAGVIISDQNRTPDFIVNFSVMSRELPVAFQ